MQLDKSFDSYPGNMVFRPYREFYESNIRKATDSSNDVNMLELGADLGISGRLFCEILDAIGKPWKLTFVDVNYHVELAKIVNNSDTYFLHMGWEDAINTIDDGSLDVIHVDVGDHNSDETKEIFNTYKDKLKPDGCFIWHDASPLVFTVYNYIAFELQPVMGWKVDFCKEHDPFPQAAPAVGFRVK